MDKTIVLVLFYKYQNEVVNGGKMKNNVEP